MSLYQLSENANTNRYSVEVNYRTNLDEVIEGFAELVLGYVSSAMKKANYHVKMVLDEKPFRVIISAHNFQEGEWVQVLSWNKQHQCFVISKGFYHKAMKNVQVQETKKCEGMSAAEIYQTLFNSMHAIKNEKPHHIELKSFGKRGAKQGVMRPAQGYFNKGNQFS